MNVTIPMELLINDFVWKCEINKDEIKLSTNSSLNTEGKVGELAKQIFEVFNLEFHPEDFKSDISGNDINIHFQKSKDSTIYNEIENYLLEEEHLDRGLKHPLEYQMSIKNSNANEIKSRQNAGHQEKLIKIATLCALRNPEKTAETIACFGITDETALIEIAKLCARKDGWKTAEYIANFGITDKTALIEIAELCAQNNGWKTAVFIKKFNIKDEPALIKIAKLCAKDPKGRVAMNIDRFEIKNKAELIEIAKICAQNDGWGTALAIKSFGITDQDTLIEIAKLCAQNNGKGTAASIKNFGITNKLALIEIAELCVQSGGGTAGYADNFEITDQEVIIRLVKLCVIHNPAGTAESIKNFGIKDPLVVIEVAKQCAQIDGKGTARNIARFGIKDPLVLIEIAKLCAQSSGWEAAEHIRNFEIQSPKDYSDVFISCFLNSNTVSTEDLMKFLSNNYNLFVKDDSSKKLNFSSFSTAGEISNSLTEWMDGKFKETTFKKLAKAFSDIPDEDLRKEKLLLLQTFLFLGEVNLSEDQIKWVSEEGILPAILSFGRPELRPKIYMHTMEALKNSQYQKNLSQIPSRGNHNPEILIRLLLGKLLCIEGMDKKFINEFFSQCYGRSDSIFYGGKNNQILTEVLLKLLENPQKAESLLKKLDNEAKTLLQEDKGISLNQKQERILAGKKVEVNRIEQILLSSNELLQVEFTKKKETIDKQIIGLEKKIAEFGEKPSLSEKQKRILTGNKAESNRLRDMLQNGKIKDEFAKQKEALDKEIKELEEKTSISEEQELILVGKKAESNRLEKMLHSSNEILQKQFTRKKEVLDKKIGELEEKTSSSQELILAGKKAEADSLEQMLLSGKIKEEFAKKKEVLDKEIAQLEAKYSPLQIETSILKRAQTLLGILLFDDDEWTFQEKNLQEVLESLVSNHLPIGKVEKFAESYNREFISSRNPMAFYTYVAKLSSLKDPEALSYFGEQVTSVLNGTFAKERYSLENNPHLTKINEIDPKLLGLWKQGLAPIPVQGKGDLHAVDTDDFTTIFLIGTEVAGSCQHVDADPHLNKGLLGYMSGKNRMLVIRDSEGRTVARCLLKLLLDENDKPVLFREQLYPKTLRPEEELALNALAKSKAEDLKLPLFYRKGMEKGYNGILKSLEGPMPWEYSDGTGGVFKNGLYNITEACYLTDS